MLETTNSEEVELPLKTPVEAFSQMPIGEAFDLPSVMESLIFMATEPLTLGKVKETMDRVGVSLEEHELREAWGALKEKWADTTRTFGQGLDLKEISGGLLFVTASQNKAFVQAFLQEKPQKLSKAQVEVLAIVAYRQPITKGDMDDIRGVDSSAALRRLMQLKLLKILGKSEGLGRPMLYGTSKRFLEFFELNSLRDLPTLKEFDETAGRDEKLQEDGAALDKTATLVDLFQAQKEQPMFSEETMKQSEDALQSLDEALGQAERIQKDIAKNEADPIIETEL